MKPRSLVAGILSALLAAPVAAPAELPVRTVVLYKHGVGYFERSGPLGPGESARLDFKAEEMNDVLKSLTINDNGGKVTAVRYDSSIPLDKKLSEFPFHINDGEPLSAVFDQLKGAQIEMEFGPTKTAGAIVSARMVPGDKERAEREQLTMLMDSGELRNVDLSAASAIRFTDPKLQLQFKDYLAALTSSRSKDKRSVYIDSTDSKSREVRATYITPMPAWKSSYRLLFDEAGTQPTLEGWAIVDNTTGEDWTNVRISLISGKPISFISDLYDPRYISRQTAELPEDASVAPTIHSGAMAKSGAMAAAAPRSGTMGGIGGGFYQPSAGLANMQVTAEAPRLQTSMSDIAQSGPAREIADLFQYDVRGTVTVRKNESAMLPFLQQKIAARKLVIYSDSTKANPLSAAELTNTSGRTLDGGPITVYDAGAYAGEALVETVKNGDKRFISYGVDLGTRISTILNSHTDNVRELHVHDGMLVTRSAIVQKKNYAVRNVDTRAKTLVIEHPVRSGYELIDTPKPLETAQNVYRFEVKVPPTGAVDFPVTEEHVYDTQTAISSISPDVLLTYVRNKSIGDAARRQIQDIAGLKGKIATNSAEKDRLTGDIQGITRDEDRNRQNIASLSSVSGQQQLVQDYARKLADQETQIAKLRDRQAQLDTERTALQQQLDAAIEKLAF